MALFGGMKGLFGVKQPWEEGLPGLPGQSPHTIGGGSVPLGGPAEAQQAKPARWMDGGKFSVQDAIALALASIADSTNPGGGGSLAQGMLKRRLTVGDDERQRAAERDDYVWKKGVDREYDTPDLPPIIRDAEAWARMTPEQRKAYTEYQDVANPVIRQGADGLPYAQSRATDAPPPIGEDEWNSGRPIGGATVTPPRTFPPRLRR